MSDLNEKCAVFGIWSNSSNEVARDAYFGLFALQHRGQEHSGIAATDGTRIVGYAGAGLVSHVYDEQILTSLSGFAAIGHNRYSTSRGNDDRFAQPILATPKMAFAHNGNLPSTKALSDFLESKNIHLQDSSDSEMMAKAIGVYVQEGMTLAQAIEKSYPLFTGAFSCVALSNDSLIAFRDPRGIRPLSLGKRGDDIIVASETCALDTVGAELLREVEPGEMVIISKNGIESKILGSAEPKFDIFEFVYFARHDSILLGKFVYDVRKKFGEILFKEHPKEVDVIIPVPDTAIPSAIGYSQASGIPFELGLSKNRYIHRTFIEPTQALRDQKVKMKLTPLKSVIAGKRVAVIDDSIVRGTTSRKIVQMLFSAGATEVHFIVSSAPVRYPDFYGVDTPHQIDLISSQKSIKETCEHLGATSLSFLSLEGMVEATGHPKDRFSLSAFTGEYPLPLFEREKEVNRSLPNL